MNQSVRLLMLFVLTAMALGCATRPSNDAALLPIDESRLPSADIAVLIPGLGPCTDNTDRTLRLNSKHPVTVLVHGCFGSSGMFRALAQVHAFQGQQAVCFSYDDRDSLMTSSAQLRTSLNVLSQHMHDKRTTVIGHSQGGLVARKALIADRPGSPLSADIEARLVTVSAPFAGIASAQHCGSERMRKWSLGIVAVVCQVVTGSKWRDITYSSDFIRLPGQLVDQVQDHLSVVTDERDSCRKYNDNGVCIDDDFVFELSEQRFAVLESSSKVKTIEVKAGHVEIIGDRRVAPNKLITILQQNGILNPTQAQQAAAFDKLLAALYLSGQTESVQAQRVH
jgi:Putative serine esterase (DUF676)